MFNPIKLFDSLVVRNYINFWDKTGTHGKVCAHSLTLFAFIAVRLASKATEKNIIHIYETAAVTALISHIFIATFIGSDLGFRRSN